MIRRAVCTIRPGTQNRMRRSVLACRRCGVCSSGALPEAPAAGLMSHTHAQMFNASKRAAQPQPVGVQIAGWEVPQRLAELGVFEALLNLRALAVEVLDLDRGLLLGWGCR